MANHVLQSGFGFGKLPLVFASTVILGFMPCGIHDHIFLSPDSD
jgi:hypothetical protein